MASDSQYAYNQNFMFKYNFFLYDLFYICLKIMVIFIMYILISIIVRTYGDMLKSSCLIIDLFR